MKLLKTDGTILIDMPELETIKQVVKYCLDNKVLLYRADLSGADLYRADLSGANLSRADLSRADLSGADLSGANLSGADLSRADLSGADLSRADLSGADLYRAYLYPAYLSGANLSGAENIFTFNKLNGRICYAVVFGEDLYIKAGCFWGPLADFILAAKKTYGTDTTENYSAQINYLKTIKMMLNGK